MDQSLVNAAYIKVSDSYNTDIEIQSVCQSITVTPLPKR